MADQRKTYTIRVQKEALKFSAAHMATFEDGAIERLHGHNYQVAAALTGELDGAGMVLDVGVLKKWIRELCDQFDECCLIATENPLISVREENDQVHLRYKGKVYSLPREDCLLLPIPNTTMEHLGHYIARLLAERLDREPSASRMERLEVTVSENPGQTATWSLPLNA